jgi:hypothetical protein
MQAAHGAYSICRQPAAHAPAGVGRRAGGALVAKRPGNDVNAGQRFLILDDSRAGEFVGGMAGGPGLRKTPRR